MIKAVRAYIGLGANLGEPAAQIERAVLALSVTPEVKVLQRSRLIWSAAMLLPGQAEQPDYCNAVAELETTLTPLALLAELKRIEQEGGRIRRERWSARLIDLDMLHYEGVESTDEPLILPHPGVSQRSWVLAPLMEIAPDLVIGKLGPVSELLKRVDTSDLRGSDAGFQP